MGSPPFLLIVTLASALVGSGVLPPDHLHRSTATHPQVIHAHWESIEHPDAHTAFTAHGDHDTAVMLDLLVAMGPTPHVSIEPVTLPQPVWAVAVTAAEVLPPGPDTVPGPSPPPEPTAPRAPPA